MFKNQKKLPCCEYDISNLENDFKECGFPATYVWNWGCGDMFVCDEHNQLIEESEEENE